MPFRNVFIVITLYLQFIQKTHRRLYLIMMVSYNDDNDDEDNTEGHCHYHNGECYDNDTAYIR